MDARGNENLCEYLLPIGELQVDAAQAKRDLRRLFDTREEPCEILSGTSSAGNTVLIIRARREFSTNQIASLRGQTNTPLERLQRRGTSGRTPRSSVPPASGPAPSSPTISRAQPSTQSSSRSQPASTASYREQPSPYSYSSQPQYGSTTASREQSSTHSYSQAQSASTAASLPNPRSNAQYSLSTSSSSSYYRPNESGRSQSTAVDPGGQAYDGSRASATTNPRESYSAASMYGAPASNNQDENRYTVPRTYQTTESDPQIQDDIVVGGQGEDDPRHDMFYFHPVPASAEIMRQREEMMRQEPDSVDQNRQGGRRSRRH